MKILVAANYWIVRAGLRQLLNQFNRSARVLEVEQVDAAVRVARKTPNLSLVLLDLLEAGREPVEALRAVYSACPEVPIVVVSTVEDRRAVLRAIESGAQGYVLKSASASELVKALRRILNGEMYLPPALLETIPQPGASRGNHWQQSWPSLAWRTQQLTVRQRDVLALLGQGLSNAAIAETLEISPNTVRLHVSAILKVFEFSNRTQAALFSAQYCETAFGVGIGPATTATPESPLPGAKTAALRDRSHIPSKTNRRRSSVRKVNSAPKVSRKEC
jgi:DNA-binding NarL/FixJ family response regulator